VYLFN